MARHGFFFLPSESKTPVLRPPFAVAHGPTLPGCMYSAHPMPGPKTADPRPSLSGPPPVSDRFPEPPPPHAPAVSSGLKARPSTRASPSRPTQNGFLPKFCKGVFPEVRSRSTCGFFRPFPFFPFHRAPRPPKSTSSAGRRQDEDSLSAKAEGTGPWGSRLRRHVCIRMGWLAPAASDPELSPLIKGPFAWGPWWPSSPHPAMLKYGNGRFGGPVCFPSATCGWGGGARQSLRPFNARSDVRDAWWGEIEARDPS